MDQAGQRVDFKRLPVHPEAMYLVLCAVRVLQVVQAGSCGMPHGARSLTERTGNLHSPVGNFHSRGNVAMLRS